MSAPCLGRLCFISARCWPAEGGLKNWVADGCGCSMQRLQQEVLDLFALDLAGTVDWSDVGEACSSCDFWGTNMFQRGHKSPSAVSGTARLCPLC